MNSKTENILVTLCARGGSKGIPGKNIRNMAGKPLIAYSIDCAKKFSEKYNGDIALSTDSEEIAKVAAEHGLITEYRRPAPLASDAAGKIETIASLLAYEEEHRNKKYDLVLDLDVTSPLRTQEDLKEGYAILQKDTQAWNLFSVSEAGKNPYFNMVEQEQNGYFKLVKTPLKETNSRQATPKVYELNASFYFYRKSFFDAGMPSAVTDRSLIYLMPHICFDLDEPVDFEFIEFLIGQNKLGFSI